MHGLRHLPLAPRALLIECLKELRETLRCELDVPLLNVKHEKAPGDGAKPAESKA